MIRIVYVISSAEKKQTGSLVTRNLTDLVKKEHFILDSEYLTTVLGQHIHFFRSFAFRPLFHVDDLFIGLASILIPVLRIRDVYPGFRMQEPGSDLFPSRIQG
jgi:hypothetical protein